VVGNFRIFSNHRSCIDFWLAGGVDRRMLGIMNQVCPWLPEVEGVCDPLTTRRHGVDRGGAYYRDALRYAQSLWMAGKPAQAVLQLNKAWMADIPADDPVLWECPPPYRALAWILREAADGRAGFLGNPVRHFQHLASRMSGVRREVRTWRAWCCFHVAERVLSDAGYSRDGEQLAREGLWVPGVQVALGRVKRLGWAGEERLAAEEIKN
jgi:hypothetical protein